jgi:hypothetical protein
MRVLVVSLALTLAPSLRIAGDTVRGAHFAPREVVRVTIVGPAPRTQRRIRTSATGTFTVALPSYDPCLESLSIFVAGARGDTAELKLPQRACPPSP